METSQLVLSVDQVVGFYIMGKFSFNEFKR